MFDNFYFMAGLSSTGRDCYNRRFVSSPYPSLFYVFETEIVTLTFCAKGITVFKIITLSAIIKIFVLVGTISLLYGVFGSAA